MLKIKNLSLPISLKVLCSTLSLEVEKATVNFCGKGMDWEGSKMNDQIYSDWEKKSIKQKVWYDDLTNEHKEKHDME